MKQLKLKLKTFLLKTFGKQKVKIATNGNGINIFADVSAHADKIEQMSEACGLSAIVTPEKTNKFTGEVHPAKCWIGVVTDIDMADDDFLGCL